MSTHITENQLELFVLDPTALSAHDKEATENHIAECALCSEHIRSLRAFYSSVETNLAHEPSERDRRIAKDLLTSRRTALPERGVVRSDSSLREVAESYAEVIEPYRRQVLQRFVRLVRIHPVRFATATGFLLAAFALLTMSIQGPNDTNPMFAEVMNGVLKVYNNEGQVLWSRTALKIPNGNTRFRFDHGPHDAEWVSIEDIDGSGRNVVLVTGLTSSRLGLDSLYLFEGNGNLRWKIGAGKFATFGKKGMGFLGEPAFVSHVVLKSQGEQPRLFAMVGSIGFSPAKLLEIDTQTGHELHTYHHRGGSNVLLRMDIDNDGRQELIAAGVNDGFDRAYVSVLDPDRIDGHAPVPTELLPLEDIPLANEKFYLLLPISDLGKTRGHAPYNVVERALVSGDNSLIVYAREPFTTDSTIEASASVVYVFGESMRVVNLTGDDIFFKKYQKYFPHEPNIKLNLAYWNALKDSVLYWDGKRFINTPTMNRNYANNKMLP